jgi:glucokinase
VPDREHTLVAVDVGGTKIAAALVAVAPPPRFARPPEHAPSTPPTPPRVLRRVQTATPLDSPAACLDGILEAVEAVLEGSLAEGIGVGTPSMVDFARGRIVESVNVPLADVPLRALLEERFGLPCAIDNDATSAALGEHVFGAGYGVEDVLMLTLGTGVGGGIIAGGRPYRGHSGAAAELGHVVIAEDGRPCPGRSCSSRGCLEAYVSGTAMGVVALEAAMARPDGAFGRALAAGEPVDGRLLTSLALAGDDEALTLLAQAGTHLGVGITSLVNAFNPRLVVIGGAAAAAGELLFAPARAVLAARGLRPQRDEARIVAARFGVDAGVVGAAALALVEAVHERSGQK